MATLDRRFWDALSTAARPRGGLYGDVRRAPHPGGSAGKLPSTLKAVRSSAGEALVLDENMFIEKMLPGVTQRALSADEMAEYRRPFLEAGDDRWPTLQWPREVPLSGEPADVHDRIAAYSTWLRTAPLPKLFIDAEPGVFITGRIRRAGLRPHVKKDSNAVAAKEFEQHVRMCK